MLIAADRLLELETPIAELVSMGAALGSDVPFCVRGGAAHMRGRGELIEPTTVPSLYVLIAVPRFAIATPAVYRAWDDLDGPVSTREVPGPPGLAALTNDLESAAERVEPRLVGFRTRLERAAGAPAILAGSGSACGALRRRGDRRRGPRSGHRREYRSHVRRGCHPLDRGRVGGGRAVSYLPC